MKQEQLTINTELLLKKFKEYLPEALKNHEHNDTLLYSSNYVQYRAFRTHAQFMHTNLFSEYSQVVPSTLAAQTVDSVIAELTASTPIPETMKYGVKNRLINKAISAILQAEWEKRSPSGKSNQDEYADIVFDQAVYGTGFAMSLWENIQRDVPEFLGYDEDGNKVYKANKDVSVFAGNRMKRLDPFNVLRDPYARSDEDARFIMYRMVMNVDDAKQYFEEKGVPENLVKKLYPSPYTQNWGWQRDIIDFSFDYAGKGSLQDRNSFISSQRSHLSALISGFENKKIPDATSIFFFATKNNWAYIGFGGEEKKEPDFFVLQSGINEMGGGNLPVYLFRYNKVDRYLGEGIPEMLRVYTDMETKSISSLFISMFMNLAPTVFTKQNAFKNKTGVRLAPYAVNELTPMAGSNVNDALQVFTPPPAGPLVSQALLYIDESTQRRTGITTQKIGAGRMSDTSATEFSGRLSNVLTRINKVAENNERILSHMFEVWNIRFAEYNEQEDVFNLMSAKTTVLFYPKFSYRLKKQRKNGVENYERIPDVNNIINACIKATQLGIEQLPSMYIKETVIDENTIEYDFANPSDEERRIVFKDDLIEGTSVRVKARSTLRNNPDLLFEKVMRVFNIYSQMKQAGTLDEGLVKALFDTLESNIDLSSLDISTAVHNALMQPVGSQQGNNLQNKPPAGEVVEPNAPLDPTMQLSSRAQPNNQGINAQERV